MTGNKLPHHVVGNMYVTVYYVLYFEIGTKGHAKLISCSTEHQRNEVGSVGRKENK